MVDDNRLRDGGGRVLLNTFRCNADARPVVPLLMDGTRPVAVLDMFSREASIPTRFDEQFAEIRNRLVSICQGIVGRDMADDVVHDAYLRGRAAYHDLREPAAFDTWMIRIAIHQCYNAKRRSRRLGEKLPLLHRSEASADGRDIGLRDAIERLPLRERTIIVLHYGYGYELREIAALLGLSATNTRTVLFRARQRMSREIGEAT